MLDLNITDETFHDLCQPCTYQIVPRCLSLLNTWTDRYTWRYSSLKWSERRLSMSHISAVKKHRGKGHYLHSLLDSFTVGHDSFRHCTATSNRFTVELKEVHLQGAARRNKGRGAEEKRRPRFVCSFCCSLAVTQYCCFYFYPFSYEEHFFSHMLAFLHFINTFNTLIFISGNGPWMSFFNMCKKQYIYFCSNFKSTYFSCNQ